MDDRVRVGREASKADLNGAGAPRTDGTSREGAAGGLGL
jgi:hypothetical protein